MKAILVLAILCLAAQSCPLTDLYKGFITSFPIETELQNMILNNGLDCIQQGGATLVQGFMALQQDYQQKNLLQALKDLLAAEQALETQISPKCFTAAYLFKQWAETHVNMTDDYDDYYYWEKRSVTNAMAVQSFFEAIVEVLHQNMTGAGQKLAFALGAGSRLVNFEADLHKRKEYDYYGYYNYEDYLVEREKYMNESIRGFFLELGVNKTQVNDTVICMRKVLNNTETFFRGRDFEDAMKAILKMVKTIDECKSVQHVDFTTINYAFELFTRYPLEFTFKVISNYYLHIGEITQLKTNSNIERQNKDNELSGRLDAKSFKLAFKDILY